jgi:hypothetical protein
VAVTSRSCSACVEPVVVSTPEAVVGLLMLVSTLAPVLLLPCAVVELPVVPAVPAVDPLMPVPVLEVVPVEPVVVLPDAAGVVDPLVAVVLPLADVLGLVCTVVVVVVVVVVPLGVVVVTGPVLALAVDGCVLALVPVEAEPLGETVDPAGGAPEAVPLAVVPAAVPDVPVAPIDPLVRLGAAPAPIQLPVTRTS